ncbi:ABC transporter substrate-binding protein [Anaerosporobacter sp.]
MNKKKSVLVTMVALVCMLLTLGGCEKSKKDESVKKIRIGVQTDNFQPYVAEAKGFFEEEFEKDGIEVELIFFTLGPPIIEAFTSEELDFGFLGDQPTYQGIANGVDLKIIGTYEASDKARGLVARNDANITSIKDLKGKKVAVPFGSNMQPLLDLYLKQEGLTTDDIELLNLSLADINTSLTSGDIEAAVTGEPWITQIVSKGEVTKITDSQGIKLFVNPIIASNDFVTDNPDLTVRLLKVLQKAKDWIDENKEETIQIVKEKTGAEEESLRALDDTVDWSLALTEEKIDALVIGVDQSYDANLLKKKIDIKSKIDLSFLEKAGIQ